MSGIFPDPWTYRCLACRRTGRRDEWATHPRQGFLICPRCWRSGRESLPEKIPLSRSSYHPAIDWSRAEPRPAGDATAADDAKGG